MGMEYRPYYLAREWGKLGHNVTIVAADYSHLRQKNPTISEPTCEKVIEQVRYLLVKTPVYEENDHHRYRNVYRFVETLWRSADELAKRYQPDLVIASSTYPLDIYPARRIAVAAHARLVYEVHDIHPDSYIEIYGYSPRHPVMLALRHAVKYAYRHADHVISILPRADLHMKELGFSADHYTYIPNGIEPEDAPHKQPQRQIDLITRYHDKGYFLVLYLGGFAPANALDELVESARQADRDVMYLFVGSGLHKAPLKRYAKQHNLCNILWLDAVDKDQVQSILPLADCLYIGALPLEVYRYGVGMNKLYDYMYSGRPIICAMNVPHNPVESARCGIVTPDNAPEEITAAIGKLKAMSPAERDAMGARGRAYVLEHHLYGVLAQRFLDAVAPPAGETSEKTGSDATEPEIQKGPGTPE